MQVGDDVDISCLKIEKTDQNSECSRLIDFRGMRVAGLVNLSGTKANGFIDLTNAKVGDSLVAFDERGSQLSCTGLNAINTQVGGDADLRGLRVFIHGQNSKCSGSINLEGMHVDGRIYLSGTIDGAINLTNAHLGDSLVICDEKIHPTILTCTGLNARNMQVVGDIDLRGLKVKKSPKQGNVNLQDVEVGGNLRLATSQRTKNVQWNFEPAVLVEQGDIDLAGVHASQIVLSGKSLGSKDHGFTLERCKVGQLTIGGFERQGEFWTTCTFPTKINLTAIEVGDWDVVDPNTDAAALLEASDPFDARVYLDFDNRLSRYGYTHRANKVYRAMADRNRKRLRSCGFPGLLSRIGSRLNYWFSGNGTSLLLIAVWLIITIVAVAIPLSFPSNVDPVDRAVTTKEQLRSQWNLWKGFGLAFSYAVPFHGASDIAKARLVGSTCWGSERSSDSDATSDGKSVEKKAAPKESASATDSGNEHTSMPTARGALSLMEHDKGKTYAIARYDRNANNAQVEVYDPLHNAWATLAPQPTSRDHLATTTRPETPPKANAFKCECDLTSIAPHDYAQIMSIFQLVLWLILAANLPSIMRKRG